MSQNNNNDIKPVAIEDEMKKSYLDYAMSVIVSRALPDVRDGLKPVHRRILYAMKEAGNDYNRPYRKSARVVGDVMGKYHPHGDMAIYDAMVRLTQNFSLRLPLIDGQGNFGSMDGDPAAASRYTEARMAKSAHDLLEDIDKETVDFQPNYDDTTTEPKVLPAKIPNLLINGTSGIAVGMATNIPTHNLGEVIDACYAMVDKPDIDVTELLEIIQGPDFPTGAIILGRKGIIDAYKTGRGSITVRSKTHIEKNKNDRESIVVDEIPYQVNKAKMVERIAELVKDKTIEGISDLRDESDRDGVRVVIELKKDAVADVILNQLYRYSPLQIGYSFNMLALVHGRPVQLSLKEILKNFIDFREEVIVKRTRFELKKSREKAHVLLGFAIAVANIDEVIALIRGASDRNQAKIELMARNWQSTSILPLIKLVEHSHEEQTNYKLSENQAQAILDLRLHRLTGLERQKIQNDLEEVAGLIQNYLAILGSRQKVLDILKSELLEVKEKYATPRRTLVEDGDSNVDIEDLIQKEDMVITVSVSGYIKRVPLVTYRTQKRGGKGRAAMTTKEEDAVREIIVANTHSKILFFTSFGKVYQLKGYKIPLASPQSKGRAIVNLLPLSNGEAVTAILPIDTDVASDNKKQQFLVFATSLGNVRRNSLSDFASIQSNGKRAMKLEGNEKLIGVRLCEEDDDIMLFTKHGLCNRFNVDKIRVFSGRDSNGVRGIRLQSKDEVLGLTVLNQGKITSEEKEAYLRQSSKIRQGLNPDEIILDDDAENSENTLQLSQERFEEIAQMEQFILTITENGYGKRSSAYQYRTTNRGGVGVDSIVVNIRNGNVIASFPVSATDDIVLVTDTGQLIRCPVADIRIAGRRTQGVILFRISDDEKVVSVSRIDNLGSDELEDEESEKDSE
jgi:DNA gyrase subunit A